MQSATELTFSRIEIEVIPHEQHRYSTVGDWYMRDGVLVIKVSKMSDWRYSLLVAVHELIEVSACAHAGITQEMVDQFDMEYEKHRHPEDTDSEPGDDPAAPYVNQHCFATGIERLLAMVLGVKWELYAREIESLPDVPRATE